MIESLPDSIASHSLSCAFNAVSDKLASLLCQAPPLVRPYTEYLSLQRGKYIRAKCLLAAALDGQGSVHGDAVTLACAVELIHLASLVHDDVIDDAPTRRGSPSLQLRFGKKKAVICGDWLLCLALSAASRIEKRQDFFDRPLTGFAAKLCLGELSQEEHNADYNLGYYRYLAIIRGKTAALFEAAFYCGAVCAGSPREEIAVLEKFGRCLGMIFQLLDDCIDYEQDEQKAGKPVSSDFAQGVITMPLIYTLKNDATFAEKVAACSPAEVVSAVKKAGGVLFTKKIAASYYRKALACLNSAEMDAEKKAELISLAAGITGAQKDTKSISI